MLIREEHSTDVESIDQLTTEAFEPMPFSDGAEAPILRALRVSGDLTLSLVATHEGVVVGHVAFSPVTIDDRHNDWYGLGPISVRADLQRQGIGRALVAEGLRRLRDDGASGAALIGNPAVYRPMGFVSDGRLRHEGVDAALVQYVVLTGTAPEGELRFAAAFQSAEAQ